MLFRSMALHADQGHPHVHVVVKAMSEQGVRLNIRKATLREWRRDFSQYLRDVGVEANATERAVRGENKSAKLDGIHWAAMRGASTHHRNRAESVARELAQGGLKAEPGKVAVNATRRAVADGWMWIADRLNREGQRDLAGLVRRFVHRMPRPTTEREQIAEQIRAHVRDHVPRSGSQYPDIAPQSVS